MNVAALNPDRPCVAVPFIDGLGDGDVLLGVGDGLLDALALPPDALPVTF
jgi:hypothetical protein